MKFAISKTVAAVALATSTLALVGVSEASAMTATISTVTASNFNVNMYWGAVSGAAHYDIRTANDPSVGTADTLWATTTGTSLSKAMTNVPGYRYFKVFAISSTGSVLASSNLVGAAKYQSGLVVRMKQDSTLTSSYPSSTAWNYQKPTWFITLDSTSKAAYVAPNFQLGEFITESTITSGLVDPQMVEHVQNARNRYGPMSINSGYRTPAHNASVGGATFSRHMYGDAVDIPASTSSVWSVLNNDFAPESPSYIETYAEGGYNHWHGDWRDVQKGYTNW